MTFWRGICETMKVAIIHYWLVGMRGGERVLERLCDLYPDAAIFTHVHVPEAMSPTIRKMNVKTSFIQKLPGPRKHYQSSLPQMPLPPAQTRRASSRERGCLAVEF